MDISVILSTYNRCTMLPIVLRGLATQTFSRPVEWEVVVVDNNSSDRTHEVVEDYCRRYPGRFRYVFESQQGVSYARNSGVRAARAEILAFLDDDVIPDVAWLQTLTACLRSGDWAGAAGPVVPKWEVPPPRWLPLEDPHVLAALVSFDAGPDAGQLNIPPFGANMAFRKEVFEKYGDFRTDLGHSGRSLLSNEDTEFGKRLLANGARLRYEPAAAIIHPVHQNRLKKRYLMRWWFDKARADVREQAAPPDMKWLARGVPLVLFRRLVIWTLRWGFTPEPSRRFSCKLRVCSIAGAILEYYRKAREARV